MATPPNTTYEHSEECHACRLLLITTRCRRTAIKIGVEIVGCSGVSDPTTRMIDGFIDREKKKQKKEDAWFGNCCCSSRAAAGVSDAIISTPTPTDRASGAAPVTLSDPSPSLGFPSSAAYHAMPHLQRAQAVSPLLAAADLHRVTMEPTVPPPVVVVAPSPKSPPRYPDLCGRRRLQLQLQILNREIGFIEEELQSLEGSQPVSRCCKEYDLLILSSTLLCFFPSVIEKATMVNEFVGTKPDPMVPIFTDLVACGDGLGLNCASISHGFAASVGVHLGCKDQAALVHRFAPVVNVDVQSLNVVMICHADVAAVVQELLVAAAKHAVVVQTAQKLPAVPAANAQKFLAVLVKHAFAQNLAVASQHAAVAQKLKHVGHPAVVHAVINRVAVTATHHAQICGVLDPSAVIVSHHVPVHAVINNVVAGNLGVAKNLVVAHGAVAGYLHASYHAALENGAAVALGLHAPVPAVPFPNSPAQSILVDVSGPALGVQMHVIYQNVLSPAASLDVCVKVKNISFQV
ncbi:hypothetical protein ZIOFF_073098 [Zingiber officinale]|uniref:Uncharacterized protein n=1 Tax=Zingiber officinale TaxID=94328 RepID=A0A8J5BY38_ZINOF|nr:hypothetical protein ZIOFF_073098 [Zingiber officinale]